ncbi:MAG TPA: hypothetical protein DCL15_11045 [Chloroflexi bacterium]|nr:hypothetical protein [Chloroflexota bacterium]HHW87957.1 hypothetical protein [Chloroflexota bacterium]
MAEQWHDNGTPLISPDAKFRADLHRALQDTHQRQQMQRQRYGDKVERPFLVDSWRVLIAFGLLASIFALGYALGRWGAPTSRRG